MRLQKIYCDKKTMKFSCIIPAYNEAPRIRAVLETVLGVPELEEVIVVDDCSTDETLAVIRSFTSPKLYVIALEKNVGKTQAVFAGLKKAQGEYIVMIDSDII